MSFEVRVESDLEALWGEAYRDIADGTRQAVRVACEEGAAHARRSHAYRDRSGKLTRSIRSYIKSFDRLGANGVIEAMAKYASYVEDGTRPHEIRPKEGHGFKGPLRDGQSRRSRGDVGTHRIALRWFVGGQPVFARVVHHPGTHPFPFMGPAHVKAEQVLERDIVVGIAHAGVKLENA